MFKRILAAASAVLLGLGIAVVGVSSAQADRPADLLCTDITDDSYGPKVDAGVDDPFYVSIPDGYTLVGYCVKAGTEPIIVTLDEPIVGPADALIDHPNKDSVSHYQLKLIETPDEEVSGAVTPEDQTCTEYELSGGFITPTPTTGVTYELYEDDGTESAAGTLIDGDFDAKSGELAPGVYWVKVLPVSDDYTVSEANTWIKVVVDPYDGLCVPTLSVVDVTFSSTQPTCEVLKGSFRFGLAPDQGEPEGAVEWTVDTGSGPQPGTPGVGYTANAGTSVTVVATATKGYGLSGDEDGVITFGPITFTAADDCLDTLALTGSTPNGMIGFAAAMVVLGGLVLAAARRQSALQLDRVCGAKMGLRGRPCEILTRPSI